MTRFISIAAAPPLARDRERLAQRERALVDSAPRDDALDHRGAERRQRADVVERGHAPARHDRKSCGLRRCARRRTRRCRSACRRARCRCRRGAARRAPRARRRASRRPSPSPRASRLDRDQPVARVDARDDRARRTPRLPRARTRGRWRASCRARSAPRPRRRGARASRACGCRRRPRRAARSPARCARRRGCCSGTPTASAVEVDDVDPLGALLGEVARLGERVLVVDGHPLVVALRKPHSAPAEDVDRGKDDHCLAPLGDASEVREHLQPHRRGLLGMELHREDVARLHARRRSARRTRSSR